MMLCSSLRDRIQPWLRDYGSFQSFAVILIYIQVMGWPPIRSFRKNSMASHPPKTNDDTEGKLGSGCLYVKVSMDGAPYLRKIDLKTYDSYMELSSALEKMFSYFTIAVLLGLLYLCTIHSRQLK